MFAFRKHLICWSVPFLLIGLAGCGQSKVVKVSGTLTYKGQPVPNAFVGFTPDNGRPSWAVTDDQGRFTLHYDRSQDGATVGKHKVSVRYEPTAASVTEPGKPPKVPKEWATFFDKYGDKSTVEVVVDKSTNDLRLDWD
jgi:hypothetical protein